MHREMVPWYCGTPHVTLTHSVRTQAQRQDSHESVAEHAGGRKGQPGANHGVVESDVAVPDAVLSEPLLKNKAVHRSTNIPSYPGSHSATVIGGDTTRARRLGSDGFNRKQSPICQNVPAAVCAPWESKAKGNMREDCCRARHAGAGRWRDARRLLEAL